MSYLMRLFEFTPSKTQFSKILTDPSLHMGFECEVMLPEESYDDDEPGEIDWEREQERINNMSWHEVSRHIGSRLKDEIQDDYQEFLDKKQNEEWDSVQAETVREYCDNNNLLNGDEEHDEIVLDDDDNIENAKREWQDDNDMAGFYDMDDYINDEYGTMSRFCSNYSIDIEPDEDSYERRGGSNIEEIHRSAADDLRNALDSPVLVGHGGPEDWHVEADGSLSGDGTGMEIVSPVFSMSDGLNALNDVFKWIRESASTTNLTGLHVSFSIEGKTDADYDYLKMIMLFDENYTAKLFKRMSNTYAQQMRTLVFANMNSTTKIQDLPERSIRAAVDRLRKLSASLHNISSKYFSFRHRANGVFEFRSMGNKGYEDRFDVIRKRIIAMAAVMKIGADPDLMAKEYLSRIYRMLTSHKFSSNETVPKLSPPAEMSSFANMSPLLLKLVNDDPKSFLSWLAAEDNLRLTVAQIRQLRMYVKNRGLRPDMYDDLRRRNMVGYNMLADYLRWPRVSQDENGQVVTDPQSAFRFR